MEPVNTVTTLWKRMTSGRPDMRKRTRAASLPSWLLRAAVAGGALALSPAIFGVVGWNDGRDLARFDPLLSLCLASRPGVQPEQLWASWSLAPQIILPLVLLAALYGRGVLAQRSLPGGQLNPARASMFAGGMLLLAAALVSPLCRLAATLASAHMVQHILIVAVIPPLLIMGRPLMTVRQGLRASSRAARPSGIGMGLSWLAQPTLAASLYAAAIWLSHMPAVYEAALRDPTIHLLLLIFQLSTGLLFWQIMVCAATPGRRDGRVGGALLMAVSTFMHTGLLGALLTFSSQPWYPIYDLRPQAWGFTPLEDQQLAGLIMWVPMSAIYLAAGLAVMAQLLRVEEPRAS
jgi:putative membrane protein